MGFHYERTPWQDGGVSQVDGQPPGTRLDKLLADGLPPLRVALEVAAAVCEILYIAQEDGVAHGDVGPDHVWITGDGVVSLGGFGEERAWSRAPERTPRGQGTDRYGLGRVVAALLLPDAAELDEAPMNGATPHDDAVARFVMGADLAGLDEGTANDIRWFVLYLMSFDRAHRPDPLRTWRSFIAFARTVTGTDLPTWAAAAHRGRGERRQIAKKLGEELEGPVKRSGPLDGGMSFSSQAASTTFWVRDDKDDLAEPVVGGGEKTGHWSIGELRAMMEEANGAPKPQRDPSQRRYTSPAAAARPAAGARFADRVEREDARRPADDDRRRARPDEGARARAEHRPDDERRRSDDGARARGERRADHERRRSDDAAPHAEGRGAHRAEPRGDGRAERGARSEAHAEPRVDDRRRPAVDDRPRPEPARGERPPPVERAAPRLADRAARRRDPDDVDLQADRSERSERSDLAERFERPDRHDVRPRPVVATTGVELPPDEAPEPAPPAKEGIPMGVIAFLAVAGLLVVMSALVLLAVLAWWYVQTPQGAAATTPTSVDEVQ